MDAIEKQLPARPTQRHRAEQLATLPKPNKPAYIIGLASSSGIHIAEEHHHPGIDADRATPLRLAKVPCTPEEFAKDWPDATSETPRHRASTL